MKSPAMLPPRKDPITNQYINQLVTKKYQSLPPQLPKFPPVLKSILNKVEDDFNDSTDNSRTEK